MKKAHWLLLVACGVLYAIPFLLHEYAWWLIFVFPVPLFYIGCIENLSFIHGYIWGVITFSLHFSGGIYILADMAHEWWVVGLVLGIAVILYQAFFCGICFWVSGYIIRVFSVKKPIMRLWIWVLLLWLFIIWVDGYSMWIFGVQEGYPFMHPLILLAKRPALLYLLPLIGKQWLTGLFLSISMSIVWLWWYKNISAMLFFGLIMGIWGYGLIDEVKVKSVPWHIRIKSLPHMICSTTKNPLVTIKIIGNHIKKIVTDYPETDLIIMPESACNIDNFADIPELLLLWNDVHVGKAIHIVFGASRWEKGNYYNSLHWVYNGVLQDCCDKRHGMLISERLPTWIDGDYVRDIYFSVTPPITISGCPRKKICMADITFVPYICSELFFNEWPEDFYHDNTIIAIVNDSIFLNNMCVKYIQKLLVLLAQFKAIQWQRDIVYVSYAQSLFIDKQGRCTLINE